MNLKVLDLNLEVFIVNSRSLKVFATMSKYNFCEVLLDYLHR